MAAIDKLRVKNYDEYQDLLKWSIAYCPQVLAYIYDINMTREDFNTAMDKHIASWRDDAKKCMDVIVPFTTMNDAINKTKEHYMSKYRAALSDNDAQLIVTSWINSYNMTDQDIADSFAMTVMNTPMRIDRILKWRCPLPFVRKYLHVQCGVNPRLEWLYKLFWKGSKDYKY